jgi:integrase
LKVKDFLSYIKEAKSKTTFKSYQVSLKRFVEWYGKDGDTILRERFEDLQSTDQTRRKRFNREVEKFHRHLKSIGLSQNTAVTYVEGVKQLFRYFDMDIKNLPIEVTRKIRTVKDYVPNVAQYRDMFNCGNILDRTIISMALDLGWRVGDFVKIRKYMLPNLDREAPIPFDLITEKEEVISKSFLSAQTINLLKSYLRTLPKDNPYLFPVNGSYYDPESIGKRLKVLARKAKIRIPKGKRLRFHCFRKRFLSECANLKIDINTAKILVGKSVPTDMLTYLSEVDHKKAFQELHKRLQLTETQTVVNAKDAEIEALKRKIAEQEIMIKGLIEFEKRRREEEDQKKGKTRITEVTLEEEIETLGKEAIKKENEEYKKLIESNNNNNH